MKSILLQILTLDGLGYLKLAAYQTFLVVLWIQEMMLIQCIMENGKKYGVILFCYFPSCYLLKSNRKTIIGNMNEMFN
jgi:hypothetical protein